MSDFEVVDKDAEIDMCYGLEEFHITKEDIAAILSGKRLYSTVNADEYAITIEMAESDDKDNSKNENLSLLPNNMCTQRYCLKNHNLGIIKCDEVCYNRTLF